MRWGRAAMKGERALYLAKGLQMRMWTKRGKWDNLEILHHWLHYSVSELLFKETNDCTRKGTLSYVHRASHSKHRLWCVCVCVFACVRGRAKGLTMKRREYVRKHLFESSRQFRFTVSACSQQAGLKWRRKFSFMSVHSLKYCLYILENVFLSLA